MIKGYKVFNENWKCRGFQYKVGETFKHNGNIELCGKGFHFCKKASDCFNYYSFDKKNKVAEVEALGLVETENDKSVTDEIRIVREIGWNEVLEIVNEGENCTGIGNTGDWNTGDWNTGDCNTGFFNTITPQLFVFNKVFLGTRNDLLNCVGIKILNWHYQDKWWIYSENMNDEEKTNHPEHKTTGGYLKKVDFKTACNIMWSNLTDEEKEEVKKIPNFDKNIFREITGIEV